MAQTVVKWRAIRQHYAGSPTTQGVLERIDPTYATDKHFARSQVRNKRLRDWADGKGSAQFRRYEFTRVSPASEPGVSLPDVILRFETAKISIAYPVLPMLYGDEDLDSMEDVIREDAQQVRDAMLSPGNLIAGVQGIIPTILEPERDEYIWFQTIDCELIYYEGQYIA